MHFASLNLNCAYVRLSLLSCFIFENVIFFVQVSAKKPSKEEKKTYDLSFPKDVVITDEILDNAVCEIWHSNPFLGVIMLEGKLRAKGIWVTRKRIRSSMIRMADHSRSLNPRRQIFRRRYAVQAPMCVWHIDGNHKLAKYVDLIYEIVFILAKWDFNQANQSVNYYYYYFRC